MAFKARKGLDLPIQGEPAQSVHDAPAAERVALMGLDYVGLGPRMAVQEGERVVLGQKLFEDRTLEGVIFTSPATGTVRAIHRGAKRAFHALVIDVDHDSDEVATFEHHHGKSDPSKTEIEALLLESGLWTALRTRPFSRTPTPGTTPHSIFVTAVDSHPLAPDPGVVLEGREADFERGLAILGKLTEGPVHLCVDEGSPIKAGDSGARRSEFTGKHPYGTVGFHIHMLAPVHGERTVWHVGYQDVARIGHLFATGRLDVSLVVSLAGQAVRQPRLLRTRLGADTATLTRGEVEQGEVRIISGSVLSGVRAMGETFGYLGRFARQVSVIYEDRKREMLGWTRPGWSRYSSLPVFLSSLSSKKHFEMTTSTHGSRRAMVPIGAYERVMPMDLMATHLLRAISVGDVEWATELGVLELDEEDLSLCTFVCPSKIDFGPALRRVLEEIRKES